MFQYAMRKTINAIPIMLGVTILVFLLVHLTPGDPARLLAGPEAYEEDIEAIRERLGLNDPLHVQYWRFLSSAVRLDFGRSFRTNRPVMQDIRTRFPNTLQLAIVAITWSVLIGVTIGIHAGVRPNSLGDSFSMAPWVQSVNATSGRIGSTWRCCMEGDWGDRPSTRKISFLKSGIFGEMVASSGMLLRFLA